MSDNKSYPFPFVLNETENDMWIYILGHFIRK